MGVLETVEWQRVLRELGGREAGSPAWHCRQSLVYWRFITNKLERKRTVSESPGDLDLFAPEGHRAGIRERQKMEKGKATGDGVGLFVPGAGGTGQTASG